MPCGRPGRKTTRLSQVGEQGAALVRPLRVVDASALVEALLGGPAGRRARAELRGTRLAAPAHLDAEVLAALARRHRAGDLSAGQVGEALQKLVSAPIRRYPLAPLVAEAWVLRDNMPMRDALYVVLARQLAAALVTMDGRLARAPGLDLAVVLV